MLPHTGILSLRALGRYQWSQPGRLHYCTQAPRLWQSRHRAQVAAELVQFVFAGWTGSMEHVFGIFRYLRGALAYRWSQGQVTAGLTVSGAQDTERWSFHPLGYSSGPVHPSPSFL